MAEGVGFEPTDGCPSSVFKTDAIDHSATPPIDCLERGGYEHGTLEFQEKPSALCLHARFQYPSILAESFALLAGEHLLSLREHLDDPPGEGAVHQAWPEVVLAEACRVEPGKPVAPIA